MKTTNQQCISPPSNRRVPLAGATFSLIVSILASSCAFAPPTAVQETVGPRVATTAEERNGSLQVYSRSVWTTADDLETPLLSYTDYDVKGADGTLFKRVANGDEAPDRVVLPKGRYTVVAQSDADGTISVPVTIESGRTTVVRLDGDANKAFAGIAKADLVRVPNGQAIGFRARHAMPLKTPAIITAQSRISVAALKPSKS